MPKTTLVRAKSKEGDSGGVGAAGEGGRGAEMELSTAEQGRRKDGGGGGGWVRERCH